MHAANENDIGPGKVRKPGVLDVLVDKTDPPALRQIGSDDQQTLWRHERAYSGHECKRVRESAEGRRVGRKDTEYVAAMLDGNRAVQATLLAPASAQRSPMTEFFARFLATIDLEGKHVADVGTGSGIL